MFYLNLKRKGDVLYAHLEGNLCKKTVHHIEYYLIPYLEKNKVKNLCCDCSKLKKLDLDGKYALLSTKIEMKKNGGSFLLCNMKKKLKEGLIGFHFKIMN